MRLIASLVLCAGLGSLGVATGFSSHGATKSADPQGNANFTAPVAGTANSGKPLVIHDWGTFTSLQDEQGHTIGGINTDEERLPNFVRNIGPIGLIQHSALARRFIKFAPRLAPEVTLRLETPVVYVHLPAGESQAIFDLSVTFHGGVLSQFYPAAQANIDGAEVRDDATHPYQPLADASTSTLTWRGVVAGGDGDGPATTSPVWLAPRKVDAALLHVGGQQERYLFYRGLGHLDALLVVRRADDGRTLRVTPRGPDMNPSRIPRLWLADLRDDGTAAFRVSEPVAHHLRSPDEPAFSELPATFTKDEYSTDRLATLRHDLHAALVADGLFTDEAQALLATWETSYFKAAGLRMFFLVPRAWTDARMPLTVSRESTLVRSMVGRIELVSPSQRQALARIAAGPVSTTAWFDSYLARQIAIGADGKSEWVPGGAARYAQAISGDPGSLMSPGLIVPADYAAYLSLGRFRDALLEDAIRRTKDPELVQFCDTYLIDWIEAMSRDAQIAGSGSAAGRLGSHTEAGA
ncbi:MAG TPA: hypothetical protein VHX44_12020, partial [Planctomycetota bacterium]|nr:hypothetical protein [Planctomycetota bacterium]